MLDHILKLLLPDGHEIGADALSSEDVIDLCITFSIASYQTLSPRQNPRLTYRLPETLKRFEPLVVELFLRCQGSCEILDDRMLLWCMAMCICVHEYSGQAPQASMLSNLDTIRTRLGHRDALETHALLYEFMHSPTTKLLLDTAMIGALQW
jgi:hypothetical protein